MHSNHIDNRRRHPRDEIQCQVQVQPIGSPADRSSHSCVSRDLSVSGIRLMADWSYPVHSQLLLTLECDEFGGTRIISRMGSVVWVESQPSAGQCQLGIAFSDHEEPTNTLLE